MQKVALVLCLNSERTPLKYFLASLIHANPRLTHLPTRSGVLWTDLTHCWLPAVVDWQSRTTTEVVI